MTTHPYTTFQIRGLAQVEASQKSGGRVADHLGATAEAYFYVGDDSESALRIEHAGSTSVPDLPAIWRHGHE